MSDTTKDLIYAIADGNAVETEAAFKAAMAEKLSSKLEDMRINLAQSMFKPQEQEATEE